MDSTCNTNTNDWPRGNATDAVEGSPSPVPTMGDSENEGMGTLRSCAVDDVGWSRQEA